MDLIPIDECVNRGLYLLRSRNLVLGVWDAESKGFIGMREKFDHRFPFMEYHHDIGAPSGTARPYQYLNELMPEEIPLVDYLRGDDGKLLVDDGYAMPNYPLIEVLNAKEQEYASTIDQDDVTTALIGAVVKYGGGFEPEYGVVSALSVQPDSVFVSRYNLGDTAAKTFVSDLQLVAPWLLDSNRERILAIIEDLGITEDFDNLPAALFALGQITGILLS